MKRERHGDMKGLLPITIVKESRLGYATAFALMSALGWGYISDANAAPPAAGGCGSVNSAAIVNGAGTQADGKGNNCIAGSNLTVSGSASSAGSITLTPATNEFVNIVAITVDNCVGATAVTAAAPTSITSSAGLGLTIMVGSGAAVGTCQMQSQVMLAPNVLRATASGAQTVTLPTFATNQTVRVNVYWYSAP